MELSVISEFFAPQDSKSLAAYFLAIGISTIFAVIVKLLHSIYFSERQSGAGIERSFVLIAPAVTGIFLVIQFSLPLSLGLLGALSFVRFRTPIKEPEEIGFLLIVIASSLTCAVFRFDVGVLLLLIVTLIAYVSRNSRLFPNTRSKKGVDLFISSNSVAEEDGSLQNDVAEVMNTLRLDHRFIGISSSEGIISFHLKIFPNRTHPSIESVDLRSKLQELPGIKSVDIVFNV